MAKQSPLSWVPHMLSMQAAKRLELTMHPSVCGAFSRWEHLCKDLPDSIPTQAFRGLLVSNVMVRPSLSLHVLGG